MTTAGGSVAGLCNCLSSEELAHGSHDALLVFHFPESFQSNHRGIAQGENLVGGMHGIVHDRVSSDNALCINESVLDGISKRLRNVVPIYR
jgi:hypothetical protein